MMKRLRNTQSGFSLVELLAVVLILAVLAAVAVPLYINTRRASAARACKANLSAIAAAESAWSLRNGAYVSGANAMAAYPAGMLGAPEGLSTKVTCPLHNHDYAIAVDAAGALTISCPDANEHAGVVPPAPDYTRAMAAPAAESIP